MKVCSVLGYLDGRAAFLGLQASPLIDHHHVGINVVVGQGGPFGDPGGAAGVQDQGQVLHGIDVQLGRGGRGLQDLLKKEVFRIQGRGLGNLAQQPAQDGFEGREEILDGADHHRLDVGSLSRPPGPWDR